MHSRAQILDLFARSSLRLTGARAAVAYETRAAEGLLRRVALYTDDLQLSPAPPSYTINYFSDDPLNTLLREPDMPLRYSPLPETPPAWVPEPVNKGISLLVLPVEEAGETYGLLLLYWDEQEQLMSEDESFLSVMTMQAASAIRTERLLAENAASQTFLSNVISSATDAIIVTDRMGRITLFNRGAVDMLGMLERDALGRQAADLYQNPDTARKRMRRALREGESSTTFETIVVDSTGGELTVQLTLSWLRDNAGAHRGYSGRGQGHQRVEEAGAGSSGGGASQGYRAHGGYGFRSHQYSAGCDHDASRDGARDAERARSRCRSQSGGCRGAGGARQDHS